MWRNLLTHARIVSRIELQFLSSTRSFIGRRRLSSSELATATSGHNIQSNRTIVNKQPQLPAETNRFHALDKELREKAQEKYKAYEDVKELQKRAPNFTVDDWHDFLCAISAMGIYGGRIFFAKNELSTMTDIIGRIAKSCERFERPIDYFNFIRLLLRFEDGFNRFRNNLPVEVEQNVSKWFIENYKRLEPSEFFEIFLIRTQWLNKKMKLKIESEEDIMKFLEHGVRLASEDNGVMFPLDMLQIIDYYSRIMQHDALAPIVSGMFDVLSARKWPCSQSDMCTALKFVVGEQRKLIRNKKEKSTKEVFRRFARDSPKTAWDWLRNSIEMTFDSDEFDHLRQLAAFAAVDAVACKAIDFDVDDLARFLSKASEPFLTNPAYVFEPKTVTMPTVNRATALQLLLGALYNGVGSEPRLRDRLPHWLRFDDAYWDRFFDMLKKETKNKEDSRRMLGRIEVALRTRPQYLNRPSFQLIVAKPLIHHRAELMRVLTAATMT